MSVYHIGKTNIKKENLDEDKIGYDSFMNFYLSLGKSYSDEKFNSYTDEIIQETWVDNIINFNPDYLLFYFRKLEENDDNEEAKMDLKKVIAECSSFSFLLHLIENENDCYQNDISSCEVMELIDYLAAYGAYFNQSAFKGLTFEEQICAKLVKLHQINELIYKYSEYPKTIKKADAKGKSAWAAYDIVFQSKYGCKFFPAVESDRWVAQLVKQKDFEALDMILSAWVKFPPLQVILDDLATHKVSLKDLFKIEDQLFMLNLIEKMEKFHMIIEDKYKESFTSLIKKEE